MAYSYARYISAGSAGPYSVPFPYRVQGDVTATVNGANATFTWTTSSTITLDAVPANGALIEIRRKTSENARLTVWNSVSQIDKDTLEAEALQSFYMAQEAIDNARDAKAKAIRLPDTDADISALPDAATRANKYVGFDANGDVAMLDGGAPGGGVGAPDTATYVTLSTDATLTNERVLSAGAGITINDAGAGSTVTLSIANAALTFAMQPSIAQNEVFGRVAAGSGAPKALTAAELMTIIQTVDGPASGLDADTVDGIAGASIVQTSRSINTSAGLEGGGNLSNDRTIGIAGGGVTNNMLATVATQTIKGRTTAGTGAPEDLTAAQVVALLTGADGAGSSLDADLLDGLQGSAYALSSRLINTSAELTGGGDLTGDLTLGIATNGVTNGMLAQVATNTFKGRVTAATGDVETLTAAQAIAILATADGAGSGLDADTVDGVQLSGLVQTSRNVNTTAPLSGGGNLTGDLTIAISTNGIGDSLLAQVATQTFKGRTTAGTGNVETLTAAQATAILDAMVGATGGASGTKGLAPAPAAGEQGLFLRGDGTWASAAGSGAPTSSKFVAYGADASLTDERILAAESTVLTITDSGTPAGNITVGVATNGITNAKLAQMAQATIKGRAAGAGTGDATDLTSAQATEILDAMVGANGVSAGTKGLVPQPLAADNVNYLRGDGTWAAPSGSGAPTSAQYVTLALDATLTAERTLAAEATVLTLTDGGAGGNATIGVATNGITNAKFRQGAALSVVGVTGNATANVADITAGTDGHVLRRSGTTLDFGQLAIGAFADNTITLAKIANINTARILGRTTAASGVIEELTVGAPLTLTGGALDFDEAATLGNNARVAVRKNSTGGAVGTRRMLNFIEGSGVTLTIADDAGGEEVDITIAASSSAPVGASYVTLGTDATLTSERVLTAGTGIGLTDGGAGGNLTVAMNVTGLSTKSGAFTPASDLVPVYIDADATVRKVAAYDLPVKESIIVAASDETTALTASTSVAKTTFRFPYAFKLQSVKVSLTTAQTSGSIMTFDVHQGGTTIFSTKPTIDNTEKTTATAATASALTSSPTTVADDDEFELFVDQIGDGTAKGVKFTFIGYRG